MRKASEFNVEPSNLSLSNFSCMIESFHLKIRMPFVLSGFDIQVSNGKSSGMFVSVFGMHLLLVLHFTFVNALEDFFISLHCGA